MADYKFTMFFEGFGQGWSESFYASGVEAHNTVINNATKADGLIAKRRVILHPSYKIKGYRVSNVDRVRDGIPGTLWGDTGKGTFQPAEGLLNSVLPVAAAINYRLFASPSKWRTYLVRGLPAGQINVNTGEVIQGPLYQGLQSLVATLNADNWCLRIAGRGDSVALTSITRVGDRIAALTTAAPVPAFAITDTLLVYGARGVSNVNGRYRVTDPPVANAYPVVRRIRSSQGTLVEGTGRVARMTFTYPQITLGKYIGVAERQTGRPSNVSRGRALVRRD